MPKYNKKFIQDLDLQINCIAQDLIRRMMEFLLTVIDGFAYLLAFFAVVLILAHLISKFLLKNKNPLKLSQESFVIITGGCMGLGKQMAIEIAKLYHSKILIVDIRKDLYKQISDKISELGASSQFHYCDLSDQKSVEQLIKALHERKRKIDLFIHNAGIVIPKLVLQTSQKQFMLQFKVNFLSPVKIIKETIDLMDNGHIAVVASMVALIPGGKLMSTYSSSKYALYSFVNCFRQQLKQSGKNVSISLACPYMIQTTMFTGFKTKLDLLFRQLKPQYLGKRLVKQFVRKQQISYVYQYEGVLFKLVGLFPTFILDYLSIYANMSNFDSIKDKHKLQINKKQQ